MAFLQSTKQDLEASLGRYVLILCKVGDFYESYGIDSLLLTTLFSLQPMGSKLRSGFPLPNLQMQVDRILDKVDVCIAVVEEVGDDETSRRKKREVKGVLKRGDSEYLHNLHMKPHHPDSSRTYMSAKLVLASSTPLGETVTVVDVARGGVKVYRNLNERAAEAVLGRTELLDGKVYHEVRRQGEERSGDAT